jgi:small subunit ribosomal protein S13
MAKVNGIDIFSADFLKSKRVEIALAKVFGLGNSSSKKIVSLSGISPKVRMKELTEAQISLINQKIKEFCQSANILTENELQAKINSDIQRLKSIKCYRGVMRERGLPVRGQSTRQNARTRKGPRKSIAKVKSKVAKQKK